LTNMSNICLWSCAPACDIDETSRGQLSGG